MKKSLGQKAATYLLSALIVAVHAIPLYILIGVAFKQRSDMSSRWIWPNYLYLDNFTRAIRKSNMLAAYRDTMIITAFAILLIVLIGSFAAYPIARRSTRFNQIIQRFIMGIMIIPPLSILVPMYSQLVKMGGISTYWGIICLLVTFELPLSIFLFTNFIKAIPRSLDEAAQIDGCGPAQSFFFIILPQLKPVIASVAILSGIACWNDYMFSLYVLQSPEIKTITLSVATFFSQGSSDINAAAAAALLGILPVVILFIFLQKYFVKGMVDSAIK